MADKTDTIINENARFKMDMKAFEVANTMYTFYAWNFLKDLKISSLLEKGSSIDDIINEFHIKNRYFLESILDILVGSNVLKYENGDYVLINIPKEYAGEDKEFLEKNYPYSVKWTEKLMNKAKDVLISGNKPADTGFDDEESLDLWDGIMNEAPYSFRSMAIKLLLKDIKDGSYILNVGCGGGIDMELMLLNTDKRINIVALDISDKYIERAKKRMKNIYNVAKGNIIKENIKRIKYVVSDILADNTVINQHKFDGIFMCLVLNHISRDNLPVLIKKLSSILDENGKMSIYQLLNFSKLKRVPIWVMHTVPSHYEYPYMDEYLKALKDNFAKVDMFANCSIAVLRNNYSER